ncbi:MAG TPA: hypothetical protein VIK71_06365, partial [Flavobacteriales bacterium]
MKVFLLQAKSLFYKSIITAVLLAVYSVMHATEYYWQPTTGSTAWATASAWNTEPDGSGTSAIPQAGDTVYFNNGGTSTVTFVNGSTNNVGSIIVSDNTTVTFQNASGTTNAVLNITTTTGVGLFVEEGSSLLVLHSSGTNRPMSVVIQNAGLTSEIAGTVTLNLGTTHNLREVLVTGTLNVGGATVTMPNAIIEGTLNMSSGAITIANVTVNGTL